MIFLVSLNYLAHQPLRSIFVLLNSICYFNFLQFFEMSKHDAIKALSIYKRAGQQVDKFIFLQSFISYRNGIRYLNLWSKVIFLFCFPTSVGWTSRSFLWLMQRLRCSSNLSVSYIETGLSRVLLDNEQGSTIKFILFFDLQPPASFLETMEEYIREAPQMGSMPNNRLVRTWKKSWIQWFSY